MIDLPSNSMQAVLGQNWLRAHRAVISYVDNCVMYFSGGRRHKLCFSPNALDLPSLSADPSLLTRLQFKTMCKDKQNKLFLVHVSTVHEPSEVEEGELSTESENIALPQVAKHIVAENADVFADTPPGLPPERGMCHTINTEAHSPVCIMHAVVFPATAGWLVLYCSFPSTLIWVQHGS